jgi:hypothetical protein
VDPVSAPRVEDLREAADQAGERPPTRRITANDRISEYAMARYSNSVTQTASGLAA